MGGLFCPRGIGRITVPTLWDTRAGCMVNNESEDILRIFDSGFGPLASGSPVLRPADIQPEIDAVNAMVYPLINNGVYRAGFATTQAAYDDAASDVSRGLTEVETILKRSRWLAGNRFTEADIRLFTTLVRFDPVYHTHFKCNERLIADSPTLSDPRGDGHDLHGRNQAPLLPDAWRNQPCWSRSGIRWPRPGRATWQGPSGPGGALQ